MNDIRYPCETASIFQGVIFVITPQSKEDLADEIDRAEQFYLGHFPYVNTEDIWEGIRYSFGGLYLNAFQVNREAIWPKG